MILKILDIVIVISVFAVCKYIVWWWTEGQKTYPEWLDYKPWCCRKCLGFWFPMAVYAAIWWIFNMPMVMILGGILTILDTIAYAIDENKRFKYERNNDKRTD